MNTQWAEYVLKLDHRVTRIAHCHACGWIDGDPYAFIDPNGHPMRICKITEYGLRQAAAEFN
jgi:hypothetical protein